MMNTAEKISVENPKKRNILITLVIIIPILIIGLIILILWLNPVYEHFIYHTIPVDEQNCILVHYFKNTRTEETYSIVERVNLEKGIIWQHNSGYYMNDWIIDVSRGGKSETLLAFITGEENIHLIQYDYETGEQHDPFALDVPLQDYQRIYADENYIYCGYLSLDKEKREREDYLIAIDRITGRIKWQQNITELTEAFSSTYHPAGYRENLLVFTSYDQLIFINRDTGKIFMKEGVSDNGFIRGNIYTYLYTPHRTSRSKEIWTFNLDTHTEDEIKTIDNIGINYFYGNTVIYFNPYSTALSQRSLYTGNMNWQLDLSEEMTVNETFVHPPSGFNTKYCPVWINSHAGNRYTNSVLAIVDVDTGEIVHQTNEVVIAEESEAMYEIYYNEGFYFIPFFIPKENSYAITVFDGKSGKFVSSFNFITPENTGLLQTLGTEDMSDKQKVVIGNNLFFRFIDQLLVFDLKSNKIIFGSSGAVRYRDFSFEVEKIYRVKFN